MAVNSVPYDSYARQVSVRLLVNGQVVPGLKEGSFTQRSARQASTFRASLALRADLSHDIGWWYALTTPISVDLQVGLASLASGEDAPDFTWQSLGKGDVDTLNFDPIMGTVQVSGRDFSNRLIEAHTSELFQNQTVGQIATALAGRHGLTAQVSTAIASSPMPLAPGSNVTTGLPPVAPSPSGPPTAQKIRAGRLWGTTQAVSTTGQRGRSTTEWEVLSTLARDFGLDLWVDGTILYMMPPTPVTANPYLVRFESPSTGIPVQSQDGTLLTIRPAGSSSEQATTKRLTMTRNLTLAPGVEVHVRSFHSRTAISTTRVARKLSKNGGEARVYNYVRPDLTPDQCTSLAQAMLTDLTAHECRISVDLPGDMLLTVRSLVRLTGTNSPFDQVYYPETVTRTASVHEGFRVQCEAKNISSASTLTVENQ